MIIELQVVIFIVVLTTALIFIQQLHIDVLMGAKYARSNRAEQKLASAFGGRIDRALENTKENIVLFIPIALIVALLDVSTGLTQTGAIVFAVGRVLHSISYLAGIIFVRSIGWFAGIVGIGMMIYSLVMG